MLALTLSSACGQPSPTPKSSEATPKAAPVDDAKPDAVPSTKAPDAIDTVEIGFSPVPSQG